MQIDKAIALIEDIIASEADYLSDPVSSTDTP